MEAASRGAASVFQNRVDSVEQAMAVTLVNGHAVRHRPVQIPGRTSESSTALVQETGERSVPAMSEGRMYVWPEPPDNEGCSVKRHIGQPALTGLGPRTILTRIISRGNSCRRTSSDDLGCIEGLAPAVRPSDNRAA